MECVAPLGYFGGDLGDKIVAYLELSYEGKFGEQIFRQELNEIGI